MKRFSLNNFLIAIWLVSIFLGACGTRKPISADEDEDPVKNGNSPVPTDPKKIANNQNPTQNPTSVSQNPTSTQNPSSNQTTTSPTGGNNDGNDSFLPTSPKLFNNQSSSSTNSDQVELYKLDNNGFCYEYSGAGLAASQLNVFPGAPAVAGKCPDSFTNYGHAMKLILTCDSMTNTVDGVQLTAVAKIYDKEITNTSIIFKNAQSAKKDCTKVSPTSGNSTP